MQEYGVVTQIPSEVDFDFWRLECCRQGFYWGL